ncbi:MAG: hypothetical protein EP344_09595 [Bacteroidetes bacterium]|nr:MAG: hypothetical protein EP344_09595 [Bacteroidota bacterium]
MIRSLLTCLTLLRSVLVLHAQYIETFSTANKGYLANFVNDFSGVDWTMSSWANQPPAAFGRDADDYFRTSGGVLSGIDFDEEVCWISPELNTAGVGDTFYFSVNLT